MRVRWQVLTIMGAVAAGTPVDAAPLWPHSVETTGGVIKVAFSGTVRDIQQALNAQGLDAGPADGMMGSRTRSAIEAYQKRNGLLVTGQPSQSLLDHLRAGSASRANAGAPDAGTDRRVGRLQRDLAGLGYAVDRSGRIDAQTRTAIRDYQRDNKLLVTGEATDALIDHVREAARNPAARQDRSDASANSNTITQIQTGLRERGYRVGTVSGQLDDATRDAIRAYQRDRGAAVTGEPTAELATQLSEGLAGTAATPENIRAVQSALNARGYTAGPADGVMGPATRDAIRLYRQRAGLAPSSDVSNDLLTSLGIAAAATGATAATTDAAKADARVTIVSDDFDDGDFVTGTRWQVLAKDFTVSDGALKSSVAVVEAKPEDLGRSVLQGVIGNVLGVQTPQQSNSAAIAHYAPFADDFDMTFRLRRIGSAPGRMHIGPYQGSEGVYGYRLMYDGGAAQPLSLVAATASGATTIASTASRSAALGDGEWHDVMFSRVPGGRMNVQVDGSMVLAASDSTLTPDIRGISFVNAAGDWEIDSIAVKAAKR